MRFYHDSTFVRHRGPGVHRLGCSVPASGDRVDGSCICIAMVGLRLDNSSLDAVTGLTCISIALRVVARASLIVIEIPPQELLRRLCGKK